MPRPPTSGRSPTRWTCWPGRDAQALSALVSGDTPGLQAAIGAGEAQVGAIATSARALRARLAALPPIDAAAAARFGPSTLNRYATLVAALPAVDALGDEWTRLAAGSVPAVQLTKHLAAHDRIAGQAVQQGAAGKYADAIRTLAKATEELAAARIVRDELATRTTRARWTPGSTATRPTIGGGGPLGGNRGVADPGDACGPGGGRPRRGGPGPAADQHERARRDPG